MTLILSSRLDPNGKVIAMECADWEMEISEVTAGNWLDIATALGCRTNWCWRVRGWGPNNTFANVGVNIPGYCEINRGISSPGLLGDAERDYTGKVGCGNAHRVTNNWPPTDWSFTDWGWGDILYGQWISADTGGGQGTLINAIVEMWLGDNIPYITNPYEESDPFASPDPINFELKSGCVISFGIQQDWVDGLGGYTANFPVIARKTIGFPFKIRDVLRSHCDLFTEDHISQTFDPPSDPYAGEYLGYLGNCHSNGLHAEIW